MRLPAPALLVITDRHHAKLPLETIARVVFGAGCRWLSLREKDLPFDARVALLHKLVAIAARWGATVGVHDDIEAARAIPGLALHLPARTAAVPARDALGAGRLIGRSAHCGDALSGPEMAILDYVTLSPVFRSVSKPGYGPALGLEGLARSARSASVPVIALGGIQPDFVRACLDAGASGVAAMGEVMRADDPARAVETFLQRL